MSRLRLLLLLLGLALLGASLAFGLGACSSAPAAAEPEPSPPAQEPEAPAPTAVAEEPGIPPPSAPGEVLPTAAAIFPTPVPTGVPQPPPALLESRRLTLEFPHQVRVGDSERIRLTLEMDEMGGITPTVEVQGHAITGQTVQIPSLYETHTMVAEARLDLAGMEVQPPGPVGETLFPGQAVTYYWSIRPFEPGTYRGTVWLHLSFLPLAGGVETRSALSAQAIEIRAVKFLGLAGGPARVVGAIGSVLGTVLGFPFIDDLLRWLWRRAKKIS